MISRRLEFENLDNTRDLGGMPAAKGRVIREGMLFRSGQLGSASPADQKKLQGLIETVVDFRSAMEQTERPDLQMPGVKNVSLPALEEPAPGVTRDEESDKLAMQRAMEDEEAARGFMLHAYGAFITSEYSRAQYAVFVRELLKPREKGILWHCTAGKDRAGFGSVITEALLGVPEQVIFEDYLFTNECLKGELARFTRMVNERKGLPADTPNRAIGYLVGAHREYLETSYAKIREIYGDMDGYLTEGVGITAEERQALIERFTL